MPNLRIEETLPSVNEPELSTPVQHEEEHRFSLIQHLEELRKRLWICLLSVLFGAAVSFTWAGQVIEWLKKPAGKILPQLAFFSPAEGVMAYLKVAFMAGFVLAVPIVLYEIWAFIRPGLSKRERRFGLAFIGWGTLLFLSGVAFAYWAFLPASLRFLLSFGDQTLVPVISISRYLEFVTTLLIACGVVFQLPLAVFLLTKLGLITPRMLLARWRVALVGMTVAAALLTPTPDVINMGLLMVPLLVLYEMSIGVSWLAGQRGTRAR